MRVAAFQEGGRLVIEERPVPKIGPRELLLKTQACGLCGSDLLKIRKRTAAPGTVLGHEVTGVVAKTGAGVTQFSEGDRLVVSHHVPCFDCPFCRHENYSMCPEFKRTNLDPGGFSEFLRISERHVQWTTLKLPDSLSFEEGTFAEPVACCLRAFRRSRLLAGDSVLVVGLGSVGLLLAQLFRHRGMQVFGIDLDPERQRRAERLGTAPWKRLATRGGVAPPGCQPVDMVLVTAGDESILLDALGWVRNGGKIHFFGETGGEPGKTPADLAQVYHREIEILATYSSAPADLKEALRLLADRVLRVSELVTHRIGLAEIESGIAQMNGRQGIKTVIQFN